MVWDMGASSGPVIESWIMPDYTGAPIPTDQVWRIFNGWEDSRREIGVIFYGGSGTSLYTMGFVESARNGKLLLMGSKLRASFDLKQAKFTYGPLQTWPKWPSPPIVEVIAVRAQLENGDWLVLAEGLRPRRSSIAHTARIGSKISNALLGHYLRGLRIDFVSHST